MPDDYIESQIADHEAKVYEGSMSAHSKKVLREMLEREDKIWQRQWVYEELQAKHGEYR